MIQVSEECQGNAIGMIKGKFSKFVGWIGQSRYYMVDGKLWSITQCPLVVRRCDDNEEQERLMRIIRRLNGRQYE